MNFTHQSLTVAVGTTVVWTNEDAASHTVTANDQSFDSQALATGATFARTFTRAGTFQYFCSIHPFMTGTVTVQ